MKYYQLTKDLPTFERGELFYISDYGNLINCKDRNIIAYTATTLTKFPNILKDWFEEVPAPVRDCETKHAFVEYINNHEEERFFQAVRNFAKEYLGDEFTFIYASKRPLEYYVQHYDKFQDTFYYECDRIHELEKGEE